MFRGIQMKAILVSIACAISLLVINAPSEAMQEEVSPTIDEYDISSCAAACQKHWQKVYWDCHAVSQCEVFATHQFKVCVNKCDEPDAGTE
jgi:hypothetical protein